MSPGSPGDLTRLPTLSEPKGRGIWTLDTFLAAGSWFPWITLNFTACKLPTLYLSKGRIQSFLSHPLIIFFSPPYWTWRASGEKQNVPNPNPKMRLTSPYDSPKNHSALLHPWEKRPGVTIFLGYGWRSKIDTQPDRSRAGRPEYMGSGVRPPGFYLWFPLTGFDTLSKLPCLKDLTLANGNNNNNNSTFIKHHKRDAVIFEATTWAESG